MNAVRVAAVVDVAPGQIVPIEAAGRKLLLARVGDAFYAAQRKCPHLGFNLCRGSLDGAAIVCPLHKAKFDLATGAIDRDPKLFFLNLKSKTALTVYPARVDRDDVVIDV